MKMLGIKIAEKRKSLGMTQIEFAEKMHVTRQTVSRWEAGTVLPDIDKIAEIADLLGVSCDYLLKDEAAAGVEAAEAGTVGIGTAEAGAAGAKGIGRLLKSLTGKTVKLTFFEDEGDIDLYDEPCRIMEFEGSWMRIIADTKKGPIEKLIPVSSVLSIEIVKEGN